jgi:4-diphosphocytidyl-2-C-methyl-D-erythritol kinase
MKIIKLNAYAKVNLTLEITGVKDGYHTLDSLVASIDIFDKILLKKRKDRLCRVTMHGQNSESIPPEQNNALKAAELFCKRFHTNGADITVYKNIPIGAGLGGSSADIGGVLKGMAKLYGIEDKNALYELADTLGSDARYMIDGGFKRMQDRGVLLFPTKISQKIPMLLICPQSAVSAGGCYREYDRQNPMFSAGENTEKCIAELEENGINGIGRYLTNDLYAAAKALNPDVEKALNEALAFAPIGAVMTGSGSCVLAVFETEEMCRYAKSRYKGNFKIYATKTVADR